MMLAMSCTSPEPAPATSSTLSEYKNARSECEILRQQLPPFAPPIKIPTGQSRDPFPSEVQDWLKKHLLPNGVYAPVGRWTSTTSKELWLIEVISPEGTSFYAILSDSTCAVSDTALWAYQQIRPDRLDQASAYLEKDGICQIRQESRITEFIGDEPRTTTSTSERRYQVDWAVGKLRPL